jgi:predicted ATPase
VDGRRTIALTAKAKGIPLALSVSRGELFEDVARIVREPDSAFGGRHDGGGVSGPDHAKSATRIEGGVFRTDISLHCGRIRKSTVRVAPPGEQAFDVCGTTWRHMRGLWYNAAMILTHAQVRNYKCIKDSTEFSLDKDVTCLVGKNEAGKTALLEAIYKLKPVRQEDGKFDVTKEYYRPSVLDYKLRHEANPDTAIVTTWELEEEDYQAIETRIGPAARKIRSVIVSKRFDDKVLTDFELDETVVVQELLKASDLEAKEQGKYKAAQSVKELVSQLGAVPEEQQQRNALIQGIKQRFGDKTAREVATEVIWDRTPRFAFFSQYLRMPGQLAVNQFKERAGANKLTDEDRVFTSLLEMIGMSVDAFATVTTYEDLIARLEAASGKLTRELRNFWPDGKHLSMEFKFDDALSADPAPFNVGKIFRARIKNERYDVTTAFDQRSNGFIWFFSFLVWFTQLERNYKTDLIVLLDEPGMALHGSAQKELLRFIEQRLAPKFQVVYTTHSPFMLDPSNLHRARPVEDVYREPGPDEDLTLDPGRGTKVFKDWWTADKLTLFPLRGCLAYDITQTLFVGHHNLLVEGPADLMFIDWFKRKLASLGRPTLDRRWVVTPCGSISKIGAFLNLFGGNHLHCAVLCDYGNGGKGEVRSLGETAIMTSAAILTADQFANKPQADVEDLLGDKFYVELVNRCYGLTGAQIFRVPVVVPGQPASRIVKAAENHMRTMPPDVPEFTHPDPADYLLRQGIEAEYPGMSEALDRFQTLFEKLNSILADYLRDKGGKR